MLKQLEFVSEKIESALKIIYKTGKVEIGFYNVLWAINHRPRQIKLIILSKNIPNNLLDKIIKAAEKKKIKIFKSRKTNIQLGEAISRRHSVSVLAILNYGSAPIEEE